MKFVIADEIFEKFPEAIVGAVVAKNIDNSGEDKEIINIIRQEENKIKNELSLDGLAKDPLIRNWRKAYKLFGEDKDRASHDALIKRLLKGAEIRHINKLVDIYNYISLKYKTPVGGEDLDKIRGNIFLKFADGNEKFVLLGSKEETHPYEGEAVYCDGKEVLCRKWNWRESDSTKLTGETGNAFMVVDALPPLDMETVKKAVSKMAELVGKCCGAEARIFVLNKENREIEF